MGITVYFAGICTHVGWDESRPRVVLVNGTQGDRIEDQHIDAHVPTLRIAASDLTDIASLNLPGTRDAIIEWKLDGTRIRIENGTGSPQQHPSYVNCMPSLRNLTPAIGAPAAEAVEGRDARLVSCVFDVTCGTISAGAFKTNGAVFSMLRAETEGAPGLSIAPFGSGDPQVLTLRDGAAITIANLGATERHDGSHDFYLHYKLAAEMPPSPGIPTATASGCILNPVSSTLPPGLTTVNVACSNSGYP